MNLTNYHSHCLYCDGRAEMPVYYLTEYFGSHIDIHHFSFVIIQQMHGTDAIIQRQFPETGNRRIALFIQIIDFQADIKFDLAGILLPYPAKLL